MSDEARNDALPDGGAESMEFHPAESTGDRSTAAEGRDVGAVARTRSSKQEFLLEAVRRGPMLDLLSEGPASASELSASIDMSRSTVHRATNALEEHDLIRQYEGVYELTSVGKTIAEKTRSYGEQVWTAVDLVPFLNIIDVDWIPIEHFVDARITRPSPRQPHTSIHRIVELVERSDSLRMLSTVLSPIYVDVGYREMMAGMEIEAVFDEEAIEIMVSQYAEKAYETIQTGNFDVYSHDGLPFELFVLTDKVGMAAHDENGIARLLIESDDPAAIEWAEEVYDSHLDEARPLLPSDL